MKEIEEQLKTAALLLPLASYRKIMAYVQLCEFEISGFSEVTYNPERNAFVVGEVYLIEQHGSGVTTHLEEEDSFKFHDEYRKMQKAKGVKSFSYPRLWWHSHVNMEAYLSPVDEDALTNRKTDNFTIALVVNKKRVMKAKAYVCVEGKYQIFGIDVPTKEWIEIKDLPVRIDLDYERIPDALKKEVEEKVKKDEPVHKKHQKGKKDWDFGKLEAPKSFPKDLNTVLMMIKKLNLFCEWDYSVGELVWESPFKAHRFVDTHKVLDELDANEYNDLCLREDESNG